MKKTGIFTVLILILGVILRTAFIDKGEGLWNDEYVSYLIASKPLFKEFVQGILSQCHMPLYYLYLKLTMFLFGDNDIILRSSSAFVGMLSIIIMYYVGKTKDFKTGLMAAFITAISSFLIYYSQEVRLYSLLFLFSALSLLAALRLLEKQSNFNIIFYIFSNLLIILTHTIGFVFVFFNLIFTSFILYKEHKSNIIKLWLSLCVISIASSPLIIKIFTTQSFSQWWGHFSLSKIGFVFTDYFSPVLTNLVNAPDNFFYNMNFSFLIFAIVPTIIAVSWIIKSLNSKFEKGLLIVALSTLLILCTAAIAGKLVLTTKYSIEIYPILIYLASIGALAFKNKYIRVGLITIFGIIHLYYLAANPLSAPKIRRAEGHKIVADMINRSNIKKDDIILLTYYDKERFEKYFDFSNNKVISINKGNFSEYLTADTSYQMAYKNGKNLYRDVFINYNNKNFENMLYKSVLNNLKNGQSVIFITLDSVSNLTPEDMYNIVKNDELYKKEPLLFMVFSYVKSETFNVLVKHLQIEHFEVKGNWRLIKLTKLNNAVKYSN